MRTATGIYRTLSAYMQQQDAAAPGGHDNSIDPHFRTGVLLGTGLCVHLLLTRQCRHVLTLQYRTSLVLSMMPGRVLSIIELFGYKGDRMEVRI